MLAISVFIIAPILKVGVNNKPFFMALAPLFSWCIGAKARSQKATFNPRPPRRIGAIDLRTKCLILKNIWTIKKLVVIFECTT